VSNLQQSALLLNGKELLVSGFQGFGSVLIAGSAVIFQQLLKVTGVSHHHFSIGTSKYSKIC
jgi:hypothetical protein